MNNSELIRQKRKIDSIIASADSLDVDDDMRVHMSKYLCVLCSGFMENVVYHVYGDYVNSKLRKQSVLNYIDTQLAKVNNPNANRLRNIAKSFNIGWEVDLNAFMQLEDRAAAVNSIMRERHKIAHGKDSDITLLRIKEYFAKCIEVAEFIEGQCNSCVE